MSLNWYKIALRLEDSQVNDILNRYEAGWTSTQIAQEYGISANKVMNIIKKHKPEISRPRGAPKTSPFIIRQMSRLYGEGMSLRELASIYNMTHQNVAFLLNKYSPDVVRRRIKPTIPEPNLEPITETQTNSI